MKKTAKKPAKKAAAKKAAKKTVAPPPWPPFPEIRVDHIAGHDHPHRYRWRWKTAGGRRLQMTRSLVTAGTLPEVERLIRAAAARDTRPVVPKALPRR